MLRWSKWPILCDVLFTTIKMFQERATETTRDLRTSARQAGGCAVWSTWTLGCSWQEGAQDGGVTGWGASAGQQVGGRLGDGPRSGRRRRGLRDPMLLSLPGQPDAAGLPGGVPVGDRAPMDVLSLPRAAGPFRTALGTAPSAQLGVPLHAVPHFCGSLSLCASVRAFVLGTSALVCHGRCAHVPGPLPTSDFALGDIHVSCHYPELAQRVREGGNE